MFQRKKSQKTLQEWDEIIRHKATYECELNLSGRKLTLNDILFIKTNIVQHYTAIKKINLRNCDINDLGAGIILDLIKASPTIQEIDLGDNAISIDLLAEITIELAKRQQAEADRLAALAIKLQKHRDQSGVKLEDQPDVIAYEKPTRKLSLKNLFTSSPGKNGHQKLQDEQKKTKSLSSIDLTY